MTEFVSQIKKVPYSDDTVFRVLSDLRNIELIKDKLPENKIKDLWCTENSCSFSVSPIGKVTFDVVEIEPNKTIKLKSQGMPFEVNAWIQLVSKAKNDTALRLTLRANLNPIIKSMVSKQIESSINKISEMLASLPYDKF